MQRRDLLKLFTVAPFAGLAAATAKPVAASVAVPELPVMGVPSGFIPAPEPYTLAEHILKVLDSRDQYTEHSVWCHILHHLRDYGHAESCDYVRTYKNGYQGMFASLASQITDYLRSHSHVCEGFRVISGTDTNTKAFDNYITIHEQYIERTDIIAKSFEIVILGLLKQMRHHWCSQFDSSNIIWVGYEIHKIPKSDLYKLTCVMRTPTQGDLK